MKYEDIVRNIQTNKSLRDKYYRLSLRGNADEIRRNLRKDFNTYVKGDVTSVLKRQYKGYKITKNGYTYDANKKGWKDNNGKYLKRGRSYNGYQYNSDGTITKQEEKAGTIPRNWLVSAAIGENPAVMTASGYRVNYDGSIDFGVENEGVKKLRETLPIIGIIGLTSMAAPLAPASTIASNAAKTFIAGTIGGAAVNEINRTVQGRDETIGQTINRLSGDRIPEWLGEFTNPGYYVSPGVFTRGFFNNSVGKTSPPLKITRTPPKTLPAPTRRALPVPTRRLPDGWILTIPTKNPSIKNLQHAYGRWTNTNVPYFTNINYNYNSLKYPITRSIKPFDLKQGTLLSQISDYTNSFIKGSELSASQPPVKKSSKKRNPQYNKDNSQLTIQSTNTPNLKNTPTIQTSNTSSNSENTQIQSNNQKQKGRTSVTSNSENTQVQTENTQVQSNIQSIDITPNSENNINNIKPKSELNDSNSSNDFNSLNISLSQFKKELKSRNLTSNSELQKFLQQEHDDEFSKQLKKLIEKKLTSDGGVIDASDFNIKKKLHVSGRWGTGIIGAGDFADLYKVLFKKQ